MGIYTSEQLQPLFDLVGEVVRSATTNGCESGLAVCDSTQLQQLQTLSSKLKNLRQHLVVGLHHRARDPEAYVFMVTSGMQFTAEMFAQRLVSEFDPDEEHLTLEQFPGPTAITEECLSVQRPGDTDDSDDDQLDDASPSHS